MFAYARAKHGELRKVDVSSDNALLVAMVVSPAFSRLADLALGDVVALIVVVTFLVGVVVLTPVLGTLILVVQLVILRCSGYRRLPRDLEQVVYASLEHLKRSIGTRPLLTMWNPLDYSSTARARGSALMSVVVLPAGVVSGALVAPARARPIIAHELAHLANRDYLIYTAVFASVLISGVGAYGLLTYDEPSFGQDTSRLLLIRLTVEAVFAVPLFIILLRRRELIADVIAMNASALASDYVRLVETGKLTDKLFHPRARVRRLAVTTDNPVLRHNGWIAAYCFYSIAASGLVIGARAMLIMDELGFAPFRIAWLALCFWAATYYPRRALRNEMSKGSSEKVGASRSAIENDLEFRCTSQVATAG